ATAASHAFDSKRRPNVANNGGSPRGETRPPGAYDKRQTLQYDALSTPTRATNRASNKASSQNHQLVINHHLFANQSSSLKLTKGMSHSITDLRELKEKPRKND